MWIERLIESSLRRHVELRPAVVVTGARQTGKTSLVRRLFSGFNYVSLDLPDHAATAEREPSLFLERHPPPLLVDESQYAPGLFRHLKIDIDAHRDQPGRFVLTGSQKFQLMREVSDSLAGRVAILELEPLSYAEVHRARPELGPEQVALRGGYPELYQEPRLDPFEFYASYVATYLERDVRSLLRVGNLRDFDRFLRACAFRSAQVLNKAELARDVGISPSTVNEWLSVLEASNQVALLEPWFVNRTRSMTKSPKLYLTDSGLLAFLLGLRSRDELERSPYKGAWWETFVFAELRKRYALASPGGRLYFWRDRAHEVDFLWHQGGRFRALEAKWTETPAPKDLDGLRYLERFLGPERKLSHAVICRAASAHPLAEAGRALSAKDPWFEGDPGATAG